MDWDVDMAKRLLGLFGPHTAPEQIAKVVEAAIDDAMEWQAVETDDLEPDDASGDDADQVTRLDSGAGELLQEPYIVEQLRQAQGDRFFELALHGLTEDEFGDGAIWLADED